jgi:hypothetical protein
MQEITTQLVTLLQTLLPGFVTSIIFYWLATAPKPSQFERVIQALIGSGIISVLVEGLRIFFLWIGSWIAIGTWNTGVETFYSLLLATILGLLLARWAHTNFLYSIAQDCKLTSRSSVLISEWEFSFSKFRDRYVVLNLLDGRRLMGYPTARPADPVSGHYLIEDPYWLGPNGEREAGVAAIMILNSDVHWVEFLQGPEEAQ